MATSYFWKIWLRPNLLTKDVDNDYIAEVSTVGNTKRNEDIAQEIVEEGSEIKYDTLLSILNQRDRIVCNLIQKGNSVLTGCSRISPRVIGSWLGANARYDPKIHKITLDMTSSNEMRKVLEEVGIEILGTKDSVGYINLVTDSATGLTDGTITPDEDIIIVGDRLKIAPEGEAGLGVAFSDDNGKNTFVTRRLILNEPKRLIARVPVLPSGEYTLKVITRFSTSGTLLNEARVIEYNRKLVIP